MINMNDYYGYYPDNDYRYYLEHSSKGQKWKDHKYIDIINGRYIYPAVNAVKSAVGTVKNKISYAKSRVGAKLNGTVNKIRNRKKLKAARTDIQSQIQENKSRLNSYPYKGTTADDYRSEGRATRQNKYLDPGSAKNKSSSGSYYNNRKGMTTKGWWDAYDRHAATSNAQRESRNKKKKAKEKWDKIRKKYKNFGKKKNVSKEYLSEVLYNSLKNRY